MVKCVTNDIYVPADAEYVHRGLSRSARPCRAGGPLRRIYRLLWHAEAQSGVSSHRDHPSRRTRCSRPSPSAASSSAATDTAQLGAAKTEAAAWSALRRRCASRSPSAATPSSGGMYNVRISLKQRYPGRRAQRHRRGVLLARRSQACVRLRRRCRRVLRRADRLGAGDALSGRPRSGGRLGLSRRAARSVARRRPHRRQGRLRLHQAVRQGQRIRLPCPRRRRCCRPPQALGRGGAGRRSGDFSTDGGARLLNDVAGTAGSSQGDSITVGNSLNTTSNDYNLLALGDGNNDTATLYYGSNNEMFAGNGNFDTLSMMSGNNNVMLIGNGRGDTM